MFYQAEYLIGSQVQQGMYTTKICVRIEQVLHKILSDMICYYFYQYTYIQGCLKKIPTFR